ncbi:hypothetical protein TNCV_435331 [Trichonephila clavipes]|nr:hypothetical protein TNCV_435331 [Trichonephila clavipes]
MKYPQSFHIILSDMGYLDEPYAQIYHQDLELKFKGSHAKMPHTGHPYARIASRRQCREVPYCKYLNENSGKLRQRDRIAPEFVTALEMCCIQKLGSRMPKKSDKKQILNKIIMKINQQVDNRERCHDVKWQVNVFTFTISFLSAHTLDYPWMRPQPVRANAKLDNCSTCAECEDLCDALEDILDALHNPDNNTPET